MSLKMFCRYVSIARLSCLLNFAYILTLCCCFFVSCLTLLIADSDCSQFFNINWGMQHCDMDCSEMAKGIWYFLEFLIASFCFRLSFCALFLRARSIKRIRWWLEFPVFLVSFHLIICFVLEYVCFILKLSCFSLVSALHFDSKLLINSTIHLCIAYLCKLKFDAAFVDRSSSRTSNLTT